jgi:hypothetical protein
LLVGTDENHEILSKDCQCPGWDSNRISPEYKSRALRLHQPSRRMWICEFNLCCKGTVYCSLVRSEVLKRWLKNSILWDYMALFPIR